VRVLRRPDRERFRRDRDTDRDFFVEPDLFSLLSLDLSIPRDGDSGFFLESAEADLSLFGFLDSGDLDLSLGFLAAGDLDFSLTFLSGLGPDADLSLRFEDLGDGEPLRGERDFVFFAAGDAARFGEERRALEDSRDLPRLGEPFSRGLECFPEEARLGDALMVEFVVYCDQI